MTRSRTQRRRLSIADTMVVIVAAAIALMLMRQWPEPRAFRLPPSLRRTSAIPSIELRVAANVWRWAVWTSLIAAVAAPTLLILWARAPRPKLSRLTRQPGFTACVAASCAWLLVFVLALTRETVDDASRWRTNGLGAVVLAMGRTFAAAPVTISAAVSAVWLVQRISGRWRPERDALDRAGRALGIDWIALGPLVEGTSVLIAYLP